MSTQDQKNKIAHSSGDDLHSLQIPDHPEHDLDSSSGVPTKVTVQSDSIHTNELKLKPEGCISVASPVSTENVSETFLDEAADGLDSSVKKLAAKIDRNIVGILGGEEEAELPTNGKKIRRKIKKKKNIGGKLVEVEEFDDQEVPERTAISEHFDNLISDSIEETPERDDGL